MKLHHFKVSREGWRWGDYTKVRVLLVLVRRMCFFSCGGKDMFLTWKLFPGVLAGAFAWLTIPLFSANLWHLTYVCYYDLSLFSMHPPWYFRPIATNKTSGPRHPHPAPCIGFHEALFLSRFLRGGEGGGGCTSAELLSSASADSYHFWSYLLVAPAREAKMDALAIRWWAKIKLLRLTVCSKADSFCYLQVSLGNTYNPSDAVQAWDSVAGLPLVVNSFCKCERRKDLYAAIFACVGKAVI